MKEIARKFNKNKFNSNKSTYYDFNLLYNEQKNTSIAEKIIFKITC